MKKSSVFTTFLFGIALLIAVSCTTTPGGSGGGGSSGGGNNPGGGGNPTTFLNVEWRMMYQANVNGTTNSNGWCYTNSGVETYLTMCYVSNLAISRWYTNNVLSSASTNYYPFAAIEDTVNQIIIFKTYTNILNSVSYVGTTTIHYILNGTNCDWINYIFIGTNILNSSDTTNYQGMGGSCSSKCWHMIKYVPVVNSGGGSSGGSTASILSTEWKLLYQANNNGTTNYQVVTNSGVEEYATETYYLTYMIVKSYTNGAVKQELTNYYDSLVEDKVNQKFVIYSETNLFSSGATFAGTATHYYVLNGNSLEWTNLLFIATNILNSLDTTNYQAMGGSSSVKCWHWEKMNANFISGPINLQITVSNFPSNGNIHFLMEIDKENHNNLNQCGNDITISSGNGSATFSSGSGMYAGSNYYYILYNDSDSDYTLDTAELRSTNYLTFSGSPVNLCFTNW